MIQLARGRWVEISPYTVLVGAERFAKRGHGGVFGGPSGLAPFVF